jgi:N-methylhydantoinase A/oxoprolinase/acetone carboxylase beta subunit
VNAGGLRVGIDVGGTFTDVVAVDAATRRLVAVVKTPTTHDHPDGVAAGIIAGLERLLAEHDIDPAAIAFIAHSTTQATNALLEGDLAQVAVVCVGGAFARWSMRFAPLTIGNAATFAPRYLDAARSTPAALVAHALADGCTALAVSAPFSVDDPTRERAVIDAAREAGLPATGGADVSTMYGLRARTRTAALNAAILPRMLRTARVTKAAVEAARIPAPLMIMRSDGGVMDVAEVERRPILTMLSGPAAGIAGALFHENVTDGIFIEVGGTSSDCSVIRRGQPELRPARIGGHRTLLQTLDVRTLGVAGGSVVTIADGRVTAVGPRSAHIAGARYAAFTPRETIVASTVATEGGFAALVAPDGTRIAITPTCAANALGSVPEGSFARGDGTAAQLALAKIGFAHDLTGDALAHAILDTATATLRGAIDELIADYALDRTTVVLVGGGGGAASLVPYAANALGFTYRIARDAEVISPLGVALALVRDVVERTIVDPTPDDLVRVRREAIEAAVASGAAPDRVEVTVDIDRTRNRVRAVASGATALVEGAAALALAGDAERATTAAAHLGEPIVQMVDAGHARIYSSAGSACVVDERGIVRAIVTGASVELATVESSEAALGDAYERGTRYGDVGRALPDVRLVYGSRIVDLSGVSEPAQALALARDELAGLAPETPLVLLVAVRPA